MATLADRLPRLDVTRPGGLAGWHSGVLKAQKAMGFEASMRDAFERTDDSMPHQHRTFHTHNLHFLPLTILDQGARPWVSFLAPLDGQPDSGWVSSPSSRELLIQSDVSPGDPLLDHVYTAEPFLVGSVGVELSTRRRNKFSGEAVAVINEEHQKVAIHVRTDQALGNCPKYFNTRQYDVVEPHPRVQRETSHMVASDRLPDEVVQAITGTSLVFLGTYFAAHPQDGGWHRSELACNHRGGNRGFVRVRKDGRTVVLPDYSGNRMMTSLGNIEATHVAALAIPDFLTGNILYLTGEAENLYGEDAKAVMPRINALTQISVTGYRFVLDALPIRASDILEWSPYNPPVRYLAEEKGDDSTAAISDTTLVLSSIVLHSFDLATFTFATSKPVDIRAGQYAVIDTSPVFQKRYAHMAREGNEQSLNDDGIRTWTISASTPRTLSLTMREMPHGKVTGALLALARGIQKEQPALLKNCHSLGLTFDLIGIGGSFSITAEALTGSSPLRLLFVCAGIGITPLLANLATLDREADIVLVWTIRDPPDIALDLLRTSMKEGSQAHLRVLLFVTGNISKTDREWPFEVEITLGRVGIDVWTTLDLPDRQIFLCGTPAFEKAAMEGLVKGGAKASDVKRESFNF